MNQKQLANATKIVQAGMKVMYAPQTRQVLQQSVKGAASGDPQALAMNVVGVIKILFDKAQGKIPPEAIPVAAMMLTYELASFVSESSGEKIPPEVVQKAVAMAMEMLKKVFAAQIEQSKKPQAPQVPQQPMPPQAPPPQGGLINQQPQMMGA